MTQTQYQPEYKYFTIAPSGVLVQSTVPFPEPKWWDNPYLHVFWSWASWGTRILAENGWHGPHNLFKKWTKR